MKNYYLTYILLLVGLAQAAPETRGAPAQGAAATKPVDIIHISGESHMLGVLPSTLPKGGTIICGSGSVLEVQYYCTPDGLSKVYELPDGAISPVWY